MMETILAGLWAGYALAVPVGAVAVLMIKITAETSFRVGASAALGATTADALYTVAAVLGGTALAAAIQPVAGVLRWSAFVILIAMAAHVIVSIMRQRNRSDSGYDDLTSKFTLRRSYVMFLGLTALNPWPAIYFVALILGRQAAQGPMSTSETIVYALAIVAASASWQLFLAFCGSMLGRVFSSRRGRILTSAFSAGLIVALAVSMVASA